MVFVLEEKYPAVITVKIVHKNGLTKVFVYFRVRYKAVFNPRTPTIVS